MTIASLSNKTQLHSQRTQAHTKHTSTNPSPEQVSCRFAIAPHGCDFDKYVDHGGTPCHRLHQCCFNPFTWETRFFHDFLRDASSGPQMNFFSTRSPGPGLTRHCFPILSQ